MPQRCQSPANLSSLQSTVASTTPPHGEAVIVEIRRLRRLPAVLANFDRHLPDTWRISLVHIGLEEIAAAPLVSAAFSVGRMRLITLPTRPSMHSRRDAWHARRMLAHMNASGRHHNADGVTHHVRIRWYNMWLKTLEFWSLFSAPHVLLFEADSILCPGPTLPLSAWLGQFAYVGAPWFPRGQSTCHLGVPCCVGVSGLSLWDRAFVADMLKRKKLASEASLLQPFKLLDNWISVELQRLETAGRALVPHEGVAIAFAVSEPPELALGRIPVHSEGLAPVGVHGPRYWPDTRSVRDGFRDGAMCPRHLRGPARSTCLRLLRQCPGINAVLLNESLDGEWSAGEWSARVDQSTEMGGGTDS